MKKEETEQLICYTVKAKSTDSVWLFKYHLNGDLESFKILSGSLSQKQIKWLFFAGNFPATGNQMHEIWLPKLKENFEIVKAEPVLDFDTLWELYGLKRKRELSEKAFNKLSPGDKVKCFLAIKPYNADLRRTGQAKAHLVTWINQKRFNDEY